MKTPSSPRPASSPSDARSQQPEYEDGDGVGAVINPVEARAGNRGRHVLLILGISLALIIAAYVLIFSLGTTTL
jgi:hypothetical protein